jgi:hypothetical protein
VYLAYIDDSEFTAKKDQQKPRPAQEQEQFQVLCSVLVRDSSFIKFEFQLNSCGFMAQKSIFDLPVDFEFHAYELFNGEGIFSGLGQEKCFEIFRRCMEEIAKLDLPILYGAVDKDKLAKQLYRSANPLDVSFRLCIEGVQTWLRTNAPDELGLIIADEFDPGKKRNLKQVFRQYRKRGFNAVLDAFKDASAKSGTEASTATFDLPNLIDDMYFGDSADSVGIQAADMCAFLIRRHLAGKQDSEWLFKIIEPHVSGSVWPE